ncbi:stage III sporulation protein AA [Lachnospiraceae bacterium XBB1006]|nr:stage III sporulation protein AA [Lachnospiraceae bacterium XBB1006]
MEEVLAILPDKVREACLQLDEGMEGLQEIRMGIGQPVYLRVAEKEYVVEPYPLTRQAFDRVIERATDYCLFAYEEQLEQGFLTLQGGHRLGVCGEGRMEDGKIKFRRLGYATLRIAHEVKGCAKNLWCTLESKGEGSGIALVSPPGGGKTTMLRDLVRLLSEQGHYVGLIDERGEVAAVYQGVTQLSVGSRTCVLSGCNKAKGMELCIRSMGPQYVAVDEIGSAQEFAAMEYAMQSGCKILCTMHGNSVQEALKKGIPENFAVVLLYQDAGGFHYDVWER